MICEILYGNHDKYMYKANHEQPIRNIFIVIYSRRIMYSRDYSSDQEMGIPTLISRQFKNL